MNHNNDKHTGGGHHPAVAAVLLSLCILGAGCITSSEEAAEPAGGVSAPATSDTGGWWVQAGAKIHYVAGAGSPDIAYVGQYGETSCNAEERPSTVGLEIPPNATTLTIELSSPPANVSQPGAGFATFSYRHEGGQWHGPDGEPRGDPVVDTSSPPGPTPSITIKDPEPGTWLIWVVPYGPVANQMYTVTLSASGASPHVGDLSAHEEFGLFGC